MGHGCGQKKDGRVTSYIFQKRRAKGLVNIALYIALTMTLSPEVQVQLEDAAALTVAVTVTAVTSTGRVNLASDNNSI